MEVYEHSIRIFSYSEGAFNPASDLTVTKKLAGLTSEERYKKRQEKEKPILDALSPSKAL